MTLTFAPVGTAAVDLTVLDPAGFEDWKTAQPMPVQAWVTAQGFTGAIGQTALISDADGALRHALAGLGSPAKRARGRFALAAAFARLPAGTYTLTDPLPPEQAEEELLGCLLSQYQFDRYKTGPTDQRNLVAPNGVDTARIETFAAAEALTRDLINTPAADMGPDNLQAAAEALAAQFGAECSTIEGAELLDQNFPMIHTVGRAADRAPRLIDMRWGGGGPRITLVGKGVCFDTGGLNLKPGASMGLMKKDMGGSATVLGLAHMIMALNLGVQLRVLIPAVENSVAGNAFRPGDVLASRKGLSVEINNTDAEGRLVLADALALADEETPDLIVSMATLTGAARVAVGPDLAPFYTDDDAFAGAVQTAAAQAADPVWRMPFHTPYEGMIEPGIADLDNAPAGGFAGSITAALFLRRFVTGTPRYMHFDIYGWQPVAAPARPKGGVQQGARALLGALQAAFDL